MKNNPRFSITLTREDWECGDGCCSDTRWEGTVYDTDGSIIADHDGEWGEPFDSIMQKCLDTMHGILNRLPVLNEDYRVIIN